MNIVKFKDIIIDPEMMVEYGLAVRDGGTYEWKFDTDFYHKDPYDGSIFIVGASVSEFCDWFNKNFRNKYVYIINWTWITSLNLDPNKYVDMSQAPGANIPNAPYGIENNSADINAWFIRLDNLKSFLDEESTFSIIKKERDKYNCLNQFTPDEDITIEELKRFRTWLAEVLLTNAPLVIDEGIIDDPLALTEMLGYYANNMYNGVIASLVRMYDYMERQSLVINNTSSKFMGLAALKISSGCGCSGGLSGITEVNGTTVCDPVQMYRNSMYNYMVKIFSMLDYWTAQVEICVEMKRYIDGILQAGLPLSSTVIDPFADCTCASTDDASVKYRHMLENLSIALGYIIDDSVSGNKNFIIKSFNDWATYLYERMQW